jgi:hypothetical protein
MPFRINLAVVRSIIRRQITLHPLLYIWLQIAFGCWGLFWFFRPPAPDEAILLLGLIAAILTIQGQMTDKHRVGWFFIMIIVFAVALKSIRKDRYDHEQKQAQILKDEHESFAAVLNQDQQHFSATVGRFDSTLSKLDTTIAQNQQHFNDTMLSERSHFDKLISANNEMQKTEHKSFASLLSKEQELLTHQEELYEFSAGKMLPANDVTPTICNPLRKNDFLIMMGKTGWVTNTFPFTLLRVSGRKIIKIDKSETGAILISIDLRMTDGTTLVRIDKNRSIVNPSSGLVVWRDKNTLAIEDQRGNEILNARYLNENTFSISGVVPYGKGIISMQSPIFQGCTRTSNTDTAMDID